jgi:hypothetical protein
MSCASFATFYHLKGHRVSYLFQGDKVKGKLPAGRGRRRYIDYFDSFLEIEFT